MSFYVYENSGNWAVASMPQGRDIIGAEPIPYELYLKLKDKPHEAANHFERKNGKLVVKPIPDGLK